MADNNPFSFLKTGHDPSAGGVTRDGKALLLSLITQWTEETLKTALLFANHNRYKCVDVESIRMSMQYNFVSGFGQQIQSLMEEAVKTQWIENAWENPLATEILERHLPHTQQMVMNQDSSIAESKQHSQNIIDYLMEKDNIQLDEEEEEEEDEEEENEEEEEEEEDDEEEEEDDEVNDKEEEEGFSRDEIINGIYNEEKGECVCSLCANIRLVNEHWSNLRPTEPWQINVYNALQNAFKKHEKR